jgi:hypothetical protein
LNLRRISALLLLCLPLTACANNVPVPSTSPSSSPAAATAPSALVLRAAPANLGCDSIGVDYHRVTFRIDPTAAEQVSAVADTGKQLFVYWAAGFQPGTATDRVVRDPSGQVVVSDGEVLSIPQGDWPRLRGHFVCPAPNALYVLLVDPS